MCHMLSLCRQGHVTATRGTSPPSESHDQGVLLAAFSGDLTESHAAGLSGFSVSGVV